MSKLSGKNFECFVINLASDQQRREAISTQLDALGISYTLFNAVNGKQLTELEISKVYDRNRAIEESHDLTPGELGCALSHWGVYRKIVENNISCALILEDDARLGANLPLVIAGLKAEFSRESSVVVLLNYVEKYKKSGRKKIGNSHHLVDPYGGIPNAHGYFITLNAARNLAEKLFPVRYVADRWDKFSESGIIKIKAIVPYCVGLTDFAMQSNLDADRVARMQLYKRGGGAYYLHRFIYKKFIYQIFVRPFQRVTTQKETW